MRSYPEITRERILLLQAYLREQVLDEKDFCCAHYQDCRSSRASDFFYEGQPHHVGRNYDLEIDGRPLRIVLVGQEYGTGERRLRLTERSAMIDRSARAGFRGRNPHMRGTSSILRLMLGREPGDDPEGETLLDGHIFDGFALVNYLMCSALRQPRGLCSGGSAKGHSSPAMRRNCARHFLRALEILEPSVIVVQGQGIRRWMETSLGLPRIGRVVERVVVAGHPLDLVTLNHPSAGGKSGYWGNSLRSGYLMDVVGPNLRQLRSLPG